MLARVAQRCGLALALCLACEAADPGTSSSTGDTGDSTTTGGPAQGEPCEVEGERLCREGGLGMYVCESAQWVSRTCRSECARVNGCSLGCILTADGEDCLCIPSDLPCG